MCDVCVYEYASINIDFSPEEELSSHSAEKQARPRSSSKWDREVSDQNMWPTSSRYTEFQIASFSYRITMSCPRFIILQNTQDSVTVLKDCLAVSASGMLVLRAPSNSRHREAYLSTSNASSYTKHLQAPARPFLPPLSRRSKEHVDQPSESAHRLGAVP